MKMFFPRIITVIAGIPLLLFCIYWGGIPFLLLVLFLVMFGLAEFAKIVRKGGYLVSFWNCEIFGVLLLLSIFLNNTELLEYGCNQGTALVITFSILMLFIIEFFRSEMQYALLRVGITVLSIFFIAWTLGHLLLIRDVRPNGMLYTYYLFSVIWSVDISAYLVGIFFGRHKLLKKISPNKTIEGFAGGLFFGTMASVMFCRIILKNEIGVNEAAVLGLLISVLAQVSDLIESLIKRSVGVKDSSSLLPGHGGILDRFDSFIFTAPFFYYYINIFH